jgi:hypothetical protein
MNAGGTFSHEILALLDSVIIMGKPPALPGDSQSLTVPGVGSSFRTRETRPGIQKKYWIPAFAGMTARATKRNDEWLLVLTDCGQAPLRGQQS